MRARDSQYGQWDEEQWSAEGQGGAYDDDELGGAYGSPYADDAQRYDQYDQYGSDEPEGRWLPAPIEHAGELEMRGMALQQQPSLVNVSTTVTAHGAPLLSYTRTMSRFYTSRKQRLSLGRYSCEVCGERIRLWAFETPSGNRTHDGCYERLAWTWTNLYAQQQRMASEGSFE